MTARLLDIEPDEYHKRPGLSASVAKTIVARSALHAWQEHPSYGAKGKVPSKIMDRGSIVGTMLLGKGARFACLPFDDRRTKAAKESIQKTRAAGLIPVLHEDHTAYEAATREIRERLDAAGYFISTTTGISEAVIEWHEPSSYGPVLCRCMMDHVDLERGIIYELKVVEDAHPDRSERTSEEKGYRIATAAYIRALAALRPALVGGIRFRFLFCEAVEPYAMYDPEPDDRFLATGERDWLRAVETWARCMTTNEWPHYQGARDISRPKWALRREGYAINEF